MPDKTSSLKLIDHSLTLRTGHIARQASGALTLQLGETVILVTVCGSKKSREGQDFFPLTVEYQEKMYAGGTIPGGFFKREGRATEKEILTARLTDRPIRPLFPNGYRNEVQIVAQVLCSDNENDPDVLCINGASISLLLSNIPFLEPVGAVRVGQMEGNFVLNPTYAERKKSDLDLLVAGTADGITMIDSQAKSVSEDRLVEALEFAHKYIQELVSFQKKFVEGISKEKIKFESPQANEELVRQIKKIAVPVFNKINEPKTKHERENEIQNFVDELVEQFVKEDGDVTDGQIQSIVHDIEYEEVRKFILDKKKRVDGRKIDEVREITAETGFLPRTHGSALFTRGQTQSLAVTTLGTSRDAQVIESYEGVYTRNFMLHYNFPPFSVGETKMMRGPGRREIGHGNLALRGLAAVIPSLEEFPYTIRVVSEILESNGSSSMASVCAGSLSLMDAGVPIKDAVSGIAMGLIQEGNDWVVLSDIAGVEDHLGDMDFKVAGTKDGVTTLQLDIKLQEGLRFDILKAALKQAHAGRMHILEKMNAVLNKPRATTSDYAPRITTIKIHPDKIRDIIGPGGKMIRKITADSGATVEVADDGTVTIASNRQDATRKAIDIISEIAQEPEIGKVYSGVIKRLMNFGAFCEFMPGREGLIHVSELSNSYVGKVEEAVNVGDQVKVKVIEIDPQGRVNLSRKQVDTQGVTPMAPRNRGRNDREKNRHGSYQARGRR